MTVYTGPVDPPATYGYPAQRVAMVRHTALGPVAIRADEPAGLPEGWWRDELGVLHTEYAGLNYKIEGGDVFVQTGTNPAAGARAVTGAGLYTYGTGASQVPTWEKVPEAQVPSDNGFRRLWKQDRLTAREAAANAPEPVGRGFGTTSPGTSRGWEDRPAAMGGPRNADDWLGSEALAEAGWSDKAIATYSTNVDPGAAVAYPAMPKKQPYEGTYYQRAAIQRAVSKGYGRPQYTPSDVGSLMRLDPQALIDFQVQAKRLEIPGSDSIVLGAPGDPATIQAYTWALTQANMMGRPLSGAMDWLGQIAAQANKSLDSNGYYTSGGAADKFDPVKTRTSVNLTGKARARAQLRSMMSQMLGRMPTNAEVEAYLAKLNAAEKADPTVTTYNYQRDGDVSTTVEQTDVDAQALAERSVKKGNPKEYEAMQSVNYYNALLDLIGG